MRSFQNKHLGRAVRLGGRRQSAPFAHPKFTAFLLAATVALTPPSTIDYSAKASACLALMLGNDETGDCVEAAANHICGVETGNAGDPSPVTDAWALEDYSAITGYVQGDPSTDNGTDPLSAMQYYRTTGFRDGRTLAGWVEVDPTKVANVQGAFYLCENLFIAMNLPSAWVAMIPTMAPGFTWDVAGAPVANNGHMVMAVGYTTSGLIICSWGMLGLLTWAAIAKYAAPANGGECYALLTLDQLANAQATAPNGLNWGELVTAFDALGGDVPAPSPSPAPVPAPTPTPAPTPKPPPAPPAPAPKPAPSPAPAPKPVVKEISLPAALAAAKTALQGPHKSLLTRDSAYSLIAKALNKLAS